LKVYETGAGKDVLFFLVLKKLLLCMYREIVWYLKRKKRPRTYQEYTDDLNVSSVQRLEISITVISKQLVDLRYHYAEGLS
jgi:hypothetical protein